MSVLNLSRAPYTFSRGWTLLVGALVAFACSGSSEEDTPKKNSTAISDDSCSTDRDCGNGNFCDGEELCRPNSAEADGRGCVAAASPAQCDDGVECTVDSCSRTTGECVHAAPDEDGDGFGDAGCEREDGTRVGVDCDDTNRAIYPGAYEVCDDDGVDEDCDPNTVGDKDEDGDGAISDSCCNGVGCGTDCDDANIAVHPLQPEFCDNLDNNCDGEVDNNTQEILWYEDLDGDGFGIENGNRILSCSIIPGRSLVATDCNDGNSGIHPAQAELCDMVDNDCDAVADEGAQCEGDPWGTEVAGPGASIGEPLGSGGSGSGGSGSGGAGSGGAGSGGSGSGGTPGVMFGDEFNGSTLNDGWTLFDLPGDATAIASGTHAELTAASGGVRNLWRDNIDAPRLLQDVVDEDFSVTLKFDGQPDSRVVGQGFVAQTDDDTFLRLGTYYNNDVLHVFAAYVNEDTDDTYFNESVTLTGDDFYMRVTRTGDSWTYAYSGDGLVYSTPITFSNAIAINQVGIYAISMADHNGYTAQLDYFRID